MRALALPVAGLLLVLGVWPFAVYLDAVPLQPDSIKWIEKAVPGSEGWSQWTFHSSHFVGYRPLTALSFSADLAAFGASASALRWTDAGLHILSALVVFLLARRLARGGGASPGCAWLAGSMALAWFVMHVGADEVVPFLSRRSYPLAVVLALSGLLAAAHVADRAGGALRGARALFPVWLLAFLSGPLLLASMFGHELGAVLAVALPVVVFSAARANPVGRTVALTVWGWAWIALGIWIRRGALAGDSGYGVAAAEPGRALEIVKLFGAALVGEFGEASRLWVVAAALVLVYYLVVSLLLARDRSRSAPLGLILVLIVYGAVIANEGVWFPRQVYPATALVALVIGLVAAWTFPGAGALSRAPRLAHAVPQALALVMMAMHSPTLVGTSPFRAERARVATSFTQSLSAELDTLEAAVEVQAVVPIPEPKTDAGDESRDDPGGEQRTSLRASNARPAARLSALRVPFRWLRLVYPDPPWTLRDILYVVDPGQSHPPRLDVPSSTLHLPANARCFGVPRRQIRELPRGQDSFRLPRPRDASRPAHLWIYGTGGLQVL